MAIVVCENSSNTAFDLLENLQSFVFVPFIVYMYFKKWTGKLSQIKFTDVKSFREINGLVPMAKQCKEGINLKFKGIKVVSYYIYLILMYTLLNYNI